MTSESVPLLEGLNVSRETESLLRAFARRVEKWNPAVNLVSQESLPVIWSRHIVDSAQLFSIAPETARHWVDVGSGGGFPGIVIAILAHELRPDLSVTLVESDRRKAAFLRLTSAELQLRVQVVADRIESCDPFGADVISARALAPLDRLCHYAAMHLAPAGAALFPKGAAHEAEVVAARLRWHFELGGHESVTDDRSMILEIKGIRRA
jgi:16S rRNA (guanine527-N7)-methyltransferase